MDSHSLSDPRVTTGYQCRFSTKLIAPLVVITDNFRLWIQLLLATGKCLLLFGYLLLFEIFFIHIGYFCFFFFFIVFFLFLCINTSVLLYSSIFLLVSFYGM